MGDAPAAVVGWDPGKRHSGAGLLVGGVLRRAWLPRGEPHEQAEVLRAVLAGEVPSGAAGLLVVEVPQVYREGRGRNRRQDLVPLAVSAGAACVVAGRLGWRMVQVLPAGWKGQLPKNVTHDRARAVLSEAELELLDRELRAVPRALRHNVMDGVALSLVGAGRLRLRRGGVL